MRPSFWTIEVLRWANRLAGYVIWSLLQFLTKEWGISYSTATKIVNVFGGMLNFSPLIIRHILDAFTGNYLMVVLSSLSYSIGLILLTVSAIGTCNITKEQQEQDCSVSTLQKVLFFSALTLIIFGSSIYHTNALEKLVEEEDSELSRTSDSVNKVVVIVVAAGAFVIPFTMKQWQYRFLFPAAFMVLATAIFLSGTMNHYVGRIKVPLVVLKFSSSIAKAICVSIYSATTKVFTRNERSKYAGCVGIAVSMILATLCCMVSAKMEILRLLDVQIYNFHGTDNTVPMSMFWLLPQYCLLGGFKGILNKSINLFFSDHDDPNSSDWFMRHFAFFILGLGNIGSVVLVSILSQLSTWGSDGTSWFVDNLNDSRLDNYYWVLALLSIGNILYYRILYSCTDLRSEVRYQKLDKRS
ncbi:hypothetical protein TIFTF001_024297 [Ficus carica]|uniref:Uncharacterized protein n=1 Tax=Ficus carica TaxID=3494 RepID=A0AA88AMB5_FICCA|nr:hypothetical protein TIFTF001_024297 [Ficus carica]